MKVTMPNSLRQSFLVMQVSSCQMMYTVYTVNTVYTHLHIVYIIKSLGYGKQAENVAKHRETNLYTELDELVKDEKSPFFKKMTEVYNESDDIACYLTNLIKAKVKDDKPVHIGVAILQWSKLLFLR